MREREQNNHIQSMLNNAQNKHIKNILRCNNSGLKRALSLFCLVDFKELIRYSQIVVNSKYSNYVATGFGG